MLNAVLRSLSGLAEHMVRAQEQGSHGKPDMNVELSDVWMFEESRSDSEGMNEVICEDVSADPVLFETFRPVELVDDDLFDSSTVFDTAGEISTGVSDAFAEIRAAAKVSA